MKPLRYGIISTASIVPRFIAALRESGGGEAVAIASRSADKAALKAAEWNIERSFGSYEDMVRDSDVDVVYVATINSDHYRCAKMALERGRHVVCEKPFTLRSSEARELFAIAKERGLFIAEGQKAVFLPVMSDIKRLLASKELGRVHFMDLTSSCSPTYNEWLRSPEAGGGALYGNAGYTIHLAKFLFDADITAYSGLCTCAGGVDEQCAVNLRVGDGILVTSRISANVLAVNNKALIQCDGGYIEMADYWKAREATVYFNSGKKETFSHPCRHELIYEIEHFNGCIALGLPQSPVMSEAVTVNAIEIMEGIRASWASPLKS
ncbi:MAG: Gfo/Idh/MocA family oxidoreductase [Synergistaceae bacterium]|nr:Gfo/Idh/MocA family oxidoreductase [Synergistaceae bacterium]